MIHGNVVDFSALIAGQPVDLVEPVLRYAGGDISHWFTKADDGTINVSGDDGLQLVYQPTGLPARLYHLCLSLSSFQVKTFVNPATNRLEPYLPEGRFVHVPVVAPTTREEELPPAIPWWQNPKYVVGYITKRPRNLSLVNTLTSQAHVVEFSDEETVAQMQDKYASTHNAHCKSYTWKALYNGTLIELQPEKTLTQNGVPDDSEELEALGLDPMDPANLVSIMLFFNDDLTVA